MHLIDARLTQSASPPTLSELAALCHVSVRQLMRSFRAAHGVAIGAYIARRRIEAAKELLLGGDSIQVISAKMNFGSPSAFAYAFRRATGLTPKEYRGATKITPLT